MFYLLIWSLFLLFPSFTSLVFASFLAFVGSVCMLLSFCPFFFFAACYSIYPSLPGLLSHFIPATFPSLSLLSSFCPFDPTSRLFFHLALTLMFFFPSLDVALCWFFWFSFIQRERERGRKRESHLHQ